jgi:hypothetical protein
MKMTEKAIQTFKKQLIENADKLASIFVDSAVEADGRCNTSLTIFADKDGEIGYCENDVYMQTLKQKILTLSNDVKDTDNNINSFKDFTGRSDTADDLKELEASYQEYLKENKERYSYMLKDLAERFAARDDIQSIYNDDTERLSYLS